MEIQTPDKTVWGPKLYAWYDGNHICGHGYQLPLIWIVLIFENISSKAEQKTMVACYQTCYTNSTKGTVHLEEPPASYSILAWCQKCWVLDSGVTLYMPQKYHKQQAYLLPGSFDGK